MVPGQPENAFEFCLEKNNSSETGAEWIKGVPQSFCGRPRTVTQGGSAPCRGPGMGSLQAWRGFQCMTSGVELGGLHGVQRDTASTFQEPDRGAGQPRHVEASGWGPPPALIPAGHAAAPCAWNHRVGHPLPLSSAPWGEGGEERCSHGWSHGTDA